MNEVFCQSCGMPMKEEHYGKNQDGTPNSDYCSYCYNNGEFCQDSTMEEMADVCAPYQVEAGLCKDVEEGKKQLMEYFPTLKRWKNA